MVTMTVMVMVTVLVMVIVMVLFFLIARAAHREIGCPNHLYM